jgi:purine-binding chemotaxis protein CheW
MVDLVKIRKKAKKQSGGAEADSRHPEQGEGSQLTVSEPEIPRSARDDGESARDDVSAPPTADREPPSTSKLERFKEEAGKRREGFIAAEAGRDTGALLELLTFHIAGEQYALDIEHIVEIVPPREATRVPNAGDSIVGIISLRGTIVTIVDVRRRLRHPPSAGPGADSRVVVVQFGGETIGFEVDRVLRVVKVDRADVEPHPVVHTSEQSEAIRGVFRQANALTILLDFDKLLDARHGTHL